MTTAEESHIHRTNRSRMGKGLAVIILVMAIGAGIHLAMGDFWNSSPPRSSLVPQEDGGGPTVPPTGQTKEFQLKFVESSDFLTLGFNAIQGEAEANPPIEVNLGDKVIIKVENGGKMPHAFAVVSDPENTESVLFDSAIKSAASPIKSGEKGEVTFTPNKEGEFFYICTVPGHSALGMKGTFVVKKAGAAPTGAGETVKPTGKSHTFDLGFSESADFKTLGFNAPQGDPKANPEIKVNAGDTVVINVANKGSMPHAFAIVTNPDDPNSVAFNAQLKSPDNPMLRGQGGKVEFVADRPGHYFYICTVPGHSTLGMKGVFIVQ